MVARIPSHSVTHPLDNGITCRGLIQYWLSLIISFTGRCNSYLQTIRQAMATKSEPTADAKFMKQEMPANGEWSEEQLEEGLKQLKLLHIKARTFPCVADC